uniref:Uncharacterized protein n=1 Tax=Bionectria ochroleuca TaxID=29856 RepID=A0A8H7N227_BIOOC
MTAFQMDAGKFFTFWVLTVLSALTFTQLYRMIGSLFRSFDNASKISGFWSSAMMVYAGYFISYQNMHPRFQWILWINPASYGYEAIMANELGGLSLECIGSQLVPNGDGYSTTTNRACTVAGAGPDGMFMIGDNYMRQSYSFQLCTFGATLES